MTGARRLLRPLLSACIVLCIGYFFLKAFQLNWASIRAQKFEIEPIFLVASALCIGGAVLLGTCGWYTALNSLSTSQISFRQSVAINNSSSLTKYLPGKVWSYALQLYWLDGRGFSKPLIVYVNLVNLLVSMATTGLLGLACLIVSGTGSFPRVLLIAAFVALLVVDLASILFNHALLNGLIALINRIFKRNIKNFEVRKSLLTRLHAIHFVAAIVSGLGAYLFCFAIGYRIDLDRTLVVIGSTLVSDVIGSLAIVVPGGLGVREGLMYAILGGQSTGSLSLILPVGSRMLSMLVDLVLGGVAFKLLSTLGPSQKAAA